MIRRDQKKRKPNKSSSQPTNCSARKRFLTTYYLKKKKKKVSIDKKIVEFSMAGMLKTHERVRSKREKERGKREGLGSIYYKERERERG